MRSVWARLGLRGRLAFSIGTIVVVAFAVVFVAVRAQMSHESSVIKREEARETSAPGATEPGEGSAISPIEDAQSDAEKTFLAVGGATLLAALLAGYLLAARTASPLRRFAATAAEVDAGDLSPRLESNPASAAELRTLAEAFNHMLDRLDQAFARQRQFVSDASHELRTPLTAIRGQLEVLTRSANPAPTELQRVESMVLTEMARIERLVDDLLILARLDEEAPLQREGISLAPYLQRLAEEEALGDVTVGELPRGTLHADPYRLTQVIRNLLVNARRHAGPTGWVAISAEAHGARLTIRVDDDGPGISPADRERVFGRFHRSEASRVRDSGGSGLGLAIARSIVELHGGLIWVEGSPQGGARVAFELDGFEPQLETA
jgi:signal transduction histidine kinase